ncbi:polymerase [Paenibacillus swuensis]|uniref:Polymerase n=1 Tax=Paenibacillus swuensis TaxID=1178515 RepID=A0A172TKQ9_9BACL|nr:FapA family protein [Paenibacillus swuensis]ANE47562.1 polymerase [Paenibacillus swuensis]
MIRTYPIEHYVSLILSDDKLKAFIQFVDIDDHFTCSVSEIEELLRRNSVQYGIQQHILAYLASDPKQYVFNQALVAVGDAPQDGKDGFVKYVYDLDSRERKPAEMQDGSVDYKEIINLRNVKKGQRIAERFPAEESIPGRAVTGEIVSGKHGKEAKLKIGKNVVCDADQNCVYAAIDGMVTKTDRDKINVFPIYEVNGDVDYNIGNIDFVGTVVIRGNVLTGFRVKAAGDIRVIGGVEGAELIADGSIEITAGILGHNKSSIRAAGHVKTSFIQEGNVNAGEDVWVTQSIMHSQVRARKSVYCNGAKGLIVGGLIQAGEQVVARTVGNTMSTSTGIEVGVVPEMRNEMQLLRSQLKTTMDNLDKTDKALALLDQLAAAGQLAQDKITMRVKLGHTKRQAIEEQNELRERIFDIEKTLEDTEKAHVDIMNVIYGGSRVVIGRYTKFIKEPVQRISFRFLDGDISMVSKY